MQEIKNGSRCDGLVMNKTESTTTKKQTQEQKVVALLKRGWFSNFQMQQKLKSSSADRAFRRAREKGLVGYEFKQRRKQNSNVYCLEYRIVENGVGAKAETTSFRDSTTRVKQACNQ